MPGSLTPPEKMNGGDPTLLHGHQHHLTHMSSSPTTLPPHFGLTHGALMPHPVHTPPSPLPTPSPPVPFERFRYSTKMYYSSISLSSPHDTAGPRHAAAGSERKGEHLFFVFDEQPE